jgi:uncharacterized protein (DUF983 family)
MANKHLTPITCKQCGKSATFEFLFQDKRMCVMCYRDAIKGQPRDVPAEAEADRKQKKGI